MTDQKSPAPGEKRVESATAAPGEKRTASRSAAPASESGDPAVHKALADLQTARQNLAAVRDAEQADVSQYEADEKAALDRLRELGYGE
jgi:hypothetical protein